MRFLWVFLILLCSFQVAPSAPGCYWVMDSKTLDSKNFEKEAFVKSLSSFSRLSYEELVHSRPLQAESFASLAYIEALVGSLLLKADPKDTMRADFHRRRFTKFVMEVHNKKKLKLDMVDENLRDLIEDISRASLGSELKRKLLALEKPEAYELESTLVALLTSPIENIFVDWGLKAKEPGLIRTYYPYVMRGVVSSIVNFGSLTYSGTLLDGYSISAPNRDMGFKEGKYLGKSLSQIVASMRQKWTSKWGKEKASYVATRVLRSVGVLMIVVSTGLTTLPYETLYMSRGEIELEVASLTVQVLEAPLSNEEVFFREQQIKTWSQHELIEERRRLLKRVTEKK